MKPKLLVPFVLAVSCLLCSCAVVPRSAGIDAGNVAYAQGDYARARDSFLAALEVATRQGAKPHIATAKYGLGRSYGQLCQFSEAEKYLREAVELESAISGGKGMHLSQDYFELARLYFDYGRYSDAIPPFEEAIPLAESLGVKSSDPIGYANVLEDYAIALSKSGRTDRAASVEKTIADLRRSNAGKAPSFRIVRFNSDCSKR